MSCVLFVFVRVVSGVAHIVNECVCYDIDTHIGDDGIRAIAEALNVNSTLAEIWLLRE